MVQDYQQPGHVNGFIRKHRCYINISKFWSNGTYYRLYNNNRRDFMKLHEHVLLDDMLQATKEYKCFKDCLKQVHIQMDRGNVEVAKHRTIDMLKSLHELSKLSEKKYKVDSYKNAMRHMNAIGVNSKVIRSLNYE